jgi:NAD(P)H-dependent FMN reductase
MHIVGICGSLRKASANGGILRALQAKLPAGSTMDIIIPGDLPLFNQDIEPADLLPQSVLDYRARVKAADGFVFATCEYNYSVSAPLKNAIDWASRGPDGNLFNDKPGAIVSAGGGVGGLRSQMHLRDIALFINVHFMNSPQLMLKIYEQPGPFDMGTGDLIHAPSLEACDSFMQAFFAWSARIALK